MTPGDCDQGKLTPTLRPSLPVLTLWTWMKMVSLPHPALATPPSLRFCVVCREGDAGRGSCPTGQHTGQKGKTQGPRKTDGGSSSPGLSAEEEGTPGCRDWVSATHILYIHGDSEVLYNYTSASTVLIIFLRGSRYKRKRKRGVDYNAEIPFEKQVPPGFYDPSEDTEDLVPPDFKRLRKQDVQGTRRDQTEQVLPLPSRKRDIVISHVLFVSVA